MPKIYAEEIQQRVEEDEEARFQRLTDIAGKLANGSVKPQVQQAFEAYVASLADLLQKHQIGARPVKNRDAAFQRFLRSRTATLSSEEACRRLARTLTLADMPDIWEDVRATKEFTASFLEDVSFRMQNQSRGGGRVVRSLAEGLHLAGDETSFDLRDKLEVTLRDRSWTDADWQGQL